MGWALCVLGYAIGPAAAQVPGSAAASRPSANAKDGAKPVVNTYDEIQRKMREPRPDLTRVVSADLQPVLDHPDRLIAYVTAPETPYLERRVAAVQGAHLVSIEQMPTVVAAINELRVEEQLHHWGVRNHPMSAIGQRPIAEAVNHNRVILGHPWRLSDDLLPYPLTFDEEAKEPWPRQVGPALDDLLMGMVPSGGDMPACRRWLDLAMTLPCSTPAEAEIFVKVTVAITHLKTPAVMSRWRQIVENPQFDNGAILIAVKLGQAVQHWDDDRARPLGQLIMLAALHNNAGPVLADAAGQLPAMCTRPRVSGAKPAYWMPATVVLALSAIAIDPKEAINDAWFHTFADPICRIVENPPYEPAYYVKSGSPLAESHRKAFASWLEKAKPGLEAEAEKEKATLDQARKESDQAAAAFSKVGAK